MKKNILYSLTFIASTALLVGCGENAWNNHLDGFDDDGFNYSGSVNVPYTLTTADYETIGKLLANVATTQEEKTAAAAIQSNFYFDQSSVYPSQVAIPYLLDQVGSDFYIYNNGSTVEVTYQEAQEVPEQIAQISDAKRLTLTSTPTISEIPDMLKTQFSDAVEGNYAIVSYLNPATASPVASGSSMVSDAPKVKKNTSMKTRTTRSQSAWTVAQALEQMAKGYEGEATVIGIVSSAEVSTSYGNATYYIKDALSDEASLEIFRGYYLNGDRFTSEDQLEVGATVVVNGSLVNYNGTYEFTTGSQILYYYDNIWSVSEALAKMADGYKGEAIVKGIISDITDISVGFGNATYFIKDNLNDSESLEIYRGYSLDGEKFTSEDEIQIGGIVIVSGSLTVYNDTYEFTTGSKIVNYFEPVTSGDTGSDVYDNLTENIQNLTVGNELTATAVVTAVSSRGVIATDNAGSILVYQASGFNQSAFPVGTVINIAGKVSAYNNGLQLDMSSEGSSMTPTGETIDYVYPTPTEYTGALMDEAIQATDNFLATYVTFTGEISVSGNYYNVIVPGASTAQGSLYYLNDEIKAQIVSGKTYIIDGYYMAISKSSGVPKFFNVVVSGIEEVVPEVADEDLLHAIYYYNGSTWSVATGATVLNPSVYNEMGFEVNNLQNPGTYIPMYLKKAYPYAIVDDEMFVAYNLTSSAASCGRFVFDGTNWTMNDNDLQQVTALYTKTNGTWTFTKYLGQATFILFEDDELILDSSYMWVSGTYCATPLAASSAYARLSAATVSIEENTITMPNENYAFYFASSFDNGGTLVKVPEGYFLIKDSNNRYLYTYNTSDSINGGDPGANPTMTDGEISSSYLFYAQKQSDGTWKINNRRADGTESTFYYSPNYGNWSIYLDTSSYISSSTLPYLYILQ